jgi:hypothetical protein
MREAQKLESLRLALTTAFSSFGGEFKMSSVPISDFKFKMSSVPISHSPHFKFFGYTGTHDNDTTQGWYASLAAKQRQSLERCRLLGISLLMVVNWASNGDIGFGTEIPSSSPV